MENCCAKRGPGDRPPTRTGSPCEGTGDGKAPDSGRCLAENCSSVTEITDTGGSRTRNAGTQAVAAGHAGDSGTARTLRGGTDGSEGTGQAQRPRERPGCGTDRTGKPGKREGFGGCGGLVGLCEIYYGTSARGCGIM